MTQPEGTLHLIAVEITWAEGSADIEIAAGFDRLLAQHAAFDDYLAEHPEAPA